MKDSLTAVQTAVGLNPGSLDDAVAADQMWAVDHALRVYFEAEDWLTERDGRIPSLRRKQAASLRA